MASTKDDSEQTEGKPVKKKLLFVLVTVLLIAAGMFLGKMLFGGSGTEQGSAPDPTATSNPSPEEAVDDQVPESPPRSVATVVELPAPEAVESLAPLSLNLADGHYMRIGLSVGLVAVEDKDGNEIDAVLEPALAAELTDSLITHISGRPVADFATAEDRDVLRDELLESFHQLSSGSVVEVYFTEFVTQ